MQLTVVVAATDAVRARSLTSEQETVATPATLAGRALTRTSEQLTLAAALTAAGAIVAMAPPLLVPIQACCRRR